MEQIIGALVVIGLLIVVFLICRELVCWYWKINACLKNQEETNMVLKQILAELKKDKGPDQVV